VHYNDQRQSCGEEVRIILRIALRITPHILLRIC
jgi:hypothetical protein